MIKLFPVKRIFIIFSIWILSISLLSPVTAQASENFETDLSTTYTVLTNGQTRIQHNFKIKNLKPLFTVSQYALKVGSTDISDVVVTSQDQEIPAEVVTTDNQTSIGITFPDKVVGQGKARQFSIKYLDSDAAIVSGQVLEVSVPKIDNSTDYHQYSVDIITPSQYGIPTRISPTNFTTKFLDDSIVTSFASINDQSINAIFGSSQIFNLTLRYNLENPNSGDRLTQIALPPDTSFQKMYYYSLDPLPQKIDVDEDGNWIATYQLPANSTTVVMLTAQAQLSLNHLPNIPVPQPQKYHQAKQEYWDTNNQLVTSATDQAKTPADIFNYVVEKLSYNYNRLDSEANRLGAAEVLANPDQALCQEFTDSFIAISRAAGIPSRMASGYAYTKNNILRPLSFVKDVLHAWPEYYDYDKQLWIPVDPTWQDTSGGVDYFNHFDLNHIVFAINGKSSTTPFPAGSYKAQNADTKDVEVSFGDQLQTTTLDLDLHLKARKLFGIPIPGWTELIVDNKTGQAHYNFSITAQTDQPQIKFNPSSVIQIERIIPFQSKHISFYVYQPNQLLPKSVKINLNYDQKQIQLTTWTIPQVWLHISGPYFLLGVGTISILIALTTGSILVHQRRQASALRRQSQKTKK